MHIAEFCLDYLIFRCFDADLTKSEIRAFLQERYYSFEDYAIRHWLDHLETSTSHPLLIETSSLQPLGQKIESFFKKHGSGSPPDSSIADVQNFQHISQWPFTQRLSTLAQLAREHKSNKRYLDLETQLQRRRRIYEEIITDPNSDELLLESLRLNGSGCYKCPKIWCEYFSDGFQHVQGLHKHLGQHERPFRCSFEDCFYQELGFDSEKGLKQHEKTSHPTDQSSEWAFPTKKPKKPLDIFSACAKGDLTTVERLVGEGVDINKTTRPNGSINALHLAVKHNHPQIVSYLIRQGCKDPGTYLFYTAFRSNSTSITIIRMLLEMEADPGAKKSRAQDLFHTAAKLGREEAIPLLLTYGVDINKRTGNYPPHSTALDLAKANAHDSTVQILLENGARDEREEAEQPPTPTPPTPVTPKNSFSPSKDNSAGADNMMTTMLSAPPNQLVPLQQLPNTALSEFNSLDANISVRARIT